MKELWANIKSMKLETILAIARAWQYEAEFDSIMEEWNRNARLWSLLLTSWPLKKPCTYPNGPPMHIKLRVEASTGISSKMRLIILMQKNNMTIRHIFKEPRCGQIHIQRWSMALDVLFAKIHLVRGVLYGRIMWGPIPPTLFDLLHDQKMIIPSLSVTIPFAVVFAVWIIEIHAK